MLTLHGDELNSYFLVKGTKKYFVFISIAFFHYKMRPTSFSKWTTSAFPAYIMLIWVKFLTVITDPHLGLYSQTFPNKVIIVKERKRILNRKTFLIHVTAMPCHQKVVSHKKIKILKGKWEGKVLHLNWAKKFTVKYFSNRLHIHYNSLVFHGIERNENKKFWRRDEKHSCLASIYVRCERSKNKNFYRDSDKFISLFFALRHETRCSR